MKSPGIYFSFLAGKDELGAETLRLSHTPLPVTFRQAQNERRQLRNTALFKAIPLSGYKGHPKTLGICSSPRTKWFFLKGGVRADVDPWMRLHECMYIAAAEEMGFKTSA